MKSAAAIYHHLYSIKDLKYLSILNLNRSGFFSISSEFLAINAKANRLISAFRTRFTLTRYISWGN